MELLITPSTTVAKVKKAFSKNFPHLKMEFFDHSHGEGQPTRLLKPVPDGTTLSHIRGFRGSGVFVFDPSTSVAGFEQGLQQRFGLPVQVYRKLGAHWLQTVETDNISLGGQDYMAVASVPRESFNRNTLFL